MRSMVFGLVMAMVMVVGVGCGDDRSGSGGGGSGGTGTGAGGTGAGGTGGEAPGESCAAGQGTCAPVGTTTAAWCPSGSRYQQEPFFETECQTGSSLNVCCIPDWNHTCPYLNTSFSFIDPVTKAPIDLFTCGFEGFYTFSSTCISPPQQGIDECVWNEAGYAVGTAMQDPQAHVKVEIGADGVVTLTGNQDGTGRTFTCTGVFSWSQDYLATVGQWTCTACLGDQCSTCEPLQAIACT